MWLISCALLTSLLIVKSQIYPPNIEMGEQIYSPEDIYLKNILPVDITQYGKK